jgi:hypothetical protein
MQGILIIGFFHTAKIGIEIAKEHYSNKNTD